MKWKFIAALAAITTASPAFAFFCPNNFNDISIGDPISKVEQLCGKPDSIEIKDPPDNQPQEWSYFLPTTQSQLQIPVASQGSLKTSVAFNADGKVMNINVNNIGVASFTNCGTTVSLGDTREQVESACGKPTLVNKQNQNQPAAPAKEDDLTKKQVEYTYNSTPSMTLIFLEGKLAERR